jgi:hypothetical protein
MRMSRMTSDMVLSGSFIEFGQMYQEGIDVALAYRRNECDALKLHPNHLQGKILLRNSREKGSKAEIARGADWIRGTFGFDVTELCQCSDDVSSRSK